MSLNKKWCQQYWEIGEVFYSDYTNYLSMVLKNLKIIEKWWKDLYRHFIPK